MKKRKIVALLGNPNCGKSSLFNQLTGLKQKVGNFPGVTVDKKIGLSSISDTEVVILDLPGIYSLYPNSLDEQVVIDILANPKNVDYPDLLVIVVDASNLKRNLLLFEEATDLGVPTILVLNMLDIAEANNIAIDSGRLAANLAVPVVELNAREGIGIEGLKLTIFKNLQAPTIRRNRYETAFSDLAKAIEEKLDFKNTYLALQMAAQTEKLGFLNQEQRAFIKEKTQAANFSATEFQSKDTLQRYKEIDKNLVGVLHQNTPPVNTLTKQLDKILLHKYWGFLIFFFVLFLVFQSVFSLAAYPMDWIDTQMASLVDYTKTILPQSQLSSLLTDGLLAGIGGVVIFIPQIALLFAFIAILEETGYMARVVVIMDRLIRRFGLNGRSVVPMISALACAVPAIMSTRTIGNFKERLITILVTPLMSCSARLPIYTILVGMVVPAKKVLGFFNLQGVTLMGLYLLGFLMALLVGMVLKYFIKSKEKSLFIMELPTYKAPRWANVGIEIINKVRTFVFEAGKIIIAISIVLWVLSSYGPGDNLAIAESKIRQSQNVDVENQVAAARLEASYAGIFGKFLEPAIKPLGYDWKIGIALITSFAAREVFVGTVSTIYSLGSDSAESHTLRDQLKLEKTADGRQVYRLSVVFSLLVFYAFAMMCMSTLAVTYRETKGWKWPIFQFVYMTALAYVFAYITFLILE